MVGGDFVSTPSDASQVAHRPLRTKPVRSGDGEVRRLLARELHDRVAQTLTTMVVDLENFKSEQAGRASVLEQMNGLQKSTRDVLNNLREVLYELRGSLSVEEGFVDSVRALVERCQERTTILTELVVQPDWPQRLKAPAALNLYRFIDEALNNAGRYSGATRIQVVLQGLSESDARVDITDNGRGIELDKPGPSGMGLIGMKERALFLGGRMSIDASPESGTVVTVVVPRSNLA